jgi:hypothetical protein
MASQDEPVGPFLEYVKDEKDIIGFIAYGLYKSEKLEWLSLQRSRSGGRRVPAKEVSSWIAIHSSDVQVRQKRLMAQEIVTEFLAEDRETEYELMKEAALKDIVSEIAAKIPDDLNDRLPQRRGFWQSTGILFAGFTGGTVQSIFGTIIFVIGAGVFVLGLDAPSYLDFTKIRELIRQEIPRGDKTGSHAETSRSR